MRCRVPFCSMLAGCLLILAAGPLAAAGPPAAVSDSRRAWLFNQGSFRPDGMRRWIEQGPSGSCIYREHFRTRDYIELFDAARKRYIRLYRWGQYVYVPAKRHYAWVCRGRWTHPAKRPLDFTRNPSEREKLSAPDQRTGFPRLGEEFEVMGPATHTYNCIGWSLGKTDSWVWPSAGGDTADLSAFDGLYTYFGYRRVNRLDYKRVPGQDKVLLYAVRRFDGSIKPTHAALQMADGSWSSKVGSLPLIRHLHPRDVSGPTYGTPYVMYVRTRALLATPKPIRTEEAPLGETPLPQVDTPLHSVE